MMPYVAKQNLTMIAVDDVLEANAVRAVTEGLNYRTTVHWTGSRAEPGKLTAADARLTGKTIINLGCDTNALASAFHTAGVAHYIAPTGAPDGTAALAFVTNLLFLRTYDVPLPEAVHRAASFHPECEQFVLT
ncbi:hypothetical protein ACXJJ3_10005 [Kribbella sp. WER1]